MGGEPGRRVPHGEMWGGWSTGFAISATMLAGVAIYGFAGYWIDRLVGTPKVFTAVGMLLGAGLGIYIVYLRYGRERESKR